MRTRHLLRALIAVAVLAVAAAVLAAATPAAEQNAYVQHNLVSDGFLPADHTDGHLVNAWGLTSLPGSPWWVADNGTNVSTLYNAAGAKQGLTVQVHNAPTGLVANDAGTGFVVTKQTPAGPVSGSSRFIFATEEGTI